MSVSLLPLTDLSHPPPPLSSSFFLPPSTSLSLSSRSFSLFLSIPHSLLTSASSCLSQSKIYLPKANNLIPHAFYNVNHNPLPFIFGILGGKILLKPDVAALVTINTIGCIVELVYNTMFITYAARRAKLGLRDPVHRVDFLGWICVCVSVSVFAALLTIMRQVIRTQSVQFMPFYLSLFLTLSAVVWFFYGVFLEDIRIAVPNVIGFLLLGIGQMVLYAVYRRGGEEGGFC